MKKTNTTTVELDESEIQTAIVEHVNRTCRDGKASASADIQIQQTEGAPGALGRGRQLVATVTIVEAD